jgi:hypothetical protein
VNPAGMSVSQICLLLGNGGHFGRFTTGAHYRVTSVPGEFAQKPDFRVPKTGFIRGLHDGLENFANRTLLLRSEGLLHGGGKAPGGKADLPDGGSRRERGWTLPEKFL